MINRSANATIKGYIYQFDLAIVQLLSAANPAATVIVEGIEDVDFKDGANTDLIQCKYYEGTDYNHSVIKEAIIHLIRHFHATGGKADTKYKIYGHYKSGQTKLPITIDVDFLKSNFLTFTSNKKTHEVHNELGMSDIDLLKFIGQLIIDINADSFDQQQDRIEKLLFSEITGCKKQDVDLFFYPLAATTIQQLAIQKSAAARTITKQQFIDRINKKEAVFSQWMAYLLGDSYYARLIKRKFFPSRTTRLPKSARIFIINVDTGFNIATLVDLLGKIGSQFSHVEHQRTPAEDRFCPYVYLIGISDIELVQIKQRLFNFGIKVADGYAFNGATFSPSHLVESPTKDNLVKLKFIHRTNQIDEVISSIKDTTVEVFEFYSDLPIPSAAITSEVLHHRIKINSMSLITEII